MRTQTMILGTATTTVLAVALFLSTPGRAAAAVDENTGVAANPGPAVANNPVPGLPSGVSEVMKMFKGGISSDILVSYINNSPLSFYLSADNIISLQQQGVPGTVLTAMLHRYGELSRQGGMAASAPAPAPAQAPAPQYTSPPV